MAAEKTITGPMDGADNGGEADEADPGFVDQRLPPDIAASLTPEQRSAVERLIGEQAWARPPVNIRLTLPFLGRGYYFTVVGGIEKRSQARRAHERQRYPLRTIANVFFFIGLGTIFYMVALVALALQASIVEF